MVAASPFFKRDGRHRQTSPIELSTTEPLPKQDVVEPGSIEDLKQINITDVDVALQAFAGHGTIELDSETEKRLLRKN